LWAANTASRLFPYTDRKGHAGCLERIIIRDAQPEDVEVVGQVFRRSSLSIDGDRDQLLAHPETLEWTGAPDGRTRVAVVDDRVIGFATTRVVTEGLELDDLFVDPDWMRRGIARALVTDAIEIARDRRIGRIVVTGNDHALGFYERQGFVADGVVETRFGPAPRMHLDLERPA
jgi:GNAT superfamily N-acetyltransferase